MEDLSALHESLVELVPKLKRGKVWCYTCGREERVNSADAVRYGWPKCCGYTMRIDSPAERAGACFQPQATAGGQG